VVGKGEMRRVGDGENGSWGEWEEGDGERGRVGE